MVKAVDIAASLEGRPVLKDRTPQTPPEAEEGVFATLSPFGEGGLFAGSFQGQSAWERHPNGDELVQVLKGSTELTILTEEGPSVLTLSAGMLTVVPQGCWHRFFAADGVTVMTATPLPTEHSAADDPTSAA